jgi:hypothetical protein
MRGSFGSPSFVGFPYTGHPRKETSMKKFSWLLVVLAVLAIGAVAPPAEAQYSASGYHGIPAQPYYGNGYQRHVYNGYVGVNYRHYSPYPMKWGTYPGYGPMPVYPGVPRYGYGYGYPGPPCAGPVPRGGTWVYVQGTYVGNGVAVGGSVRVHE